MYAVLVGGFLILLIGGWFLFRFFWEDEPEASESEVPIVAEQKEESDETLITAAVVRQKVLNNERVRFVDIRDQESFRREHIPHSINLSTGALNSFEPGEDELVVVVLSWNNPQAREVAENILRQKSRPLFVLKGGFEEWKRTGNQTLSLGNPDAFLDQAKVTPITAAEALKMIQAGNNLFILDVQPEANYQKVHLKGAVNIPLDQLERRSEEIPAGRNILVYGESALTSFQGGVRLADLNYFTARTITGETVLRPESGLPLEGTEIK